MFRVIAFTVLFSSLYLTTRSVAQTKTPASAVTLAPKIDDTSPFRCEALLRIEPASVAVGGTFKIACEVRGRGEQVHIYNGLLSERLKLPAQIVINSADGKLQHHLLQPAEGALEKSGAGCWVFLRSGRTIGRELTIKIAKPTSFRATLSRVRAIDLPPGDYYVQAIYNYWLVASWPNEPGSSGPRTIDGMGDDPRAWKWRKNMNMDAPMAISEPLKLVVTADAAPAANDPPSIDCPLRLELHPPVKRDTDDGLQTEVRIRFTNQSDKIIDVFNPLLDSRLFVVPNAVELALLNAAEKHIGNYTDVEVGSNRSPRRSDWVRFPPGGTISSNFRYRPDYVPLSEFARPDGLPAGKYLLELRGHEALVSPPPDIINHTDDATQIARHATYLDWRRSFPGPVICRSNRVELEILPRTGD
jgi:hypothetical protein